jgi:hypothetical protein
MPSVSATAACSRPQHPAFMEEPPWQKASVVEQARRSVKRLIVRTVDNGWFGLCPLHCHVVICGFQRSGSTLLQLMLETSISNVRTFGAEYEALLAAQFAPRNHPYLVTKDPTDVFYVDEIRQFYSKRPAKCRFIVTVRDPRAVLTSKHVGPSRQSDGYWVLPEEWRAYYDHLRYAQQFDDVITVYYQNLVTRPGDVENELREFIGWTVHSPFEQFHKSIPEGFDRTALNGVRPLEPARVDAWKDDKHRARIRHVLREIPDLPDCLIEMGYESDTGWVQNYI